MSNPSPGHSVIPAGHRCRVPEQSHGTLIEPRHPRHGQQHGHRESAESARGVGLDGGQYLPRQRRVLLDHEGDIHQHGALDLPRDGRRRANAGATAVAEEAEEAREDGTRVERLGREEEQLVRECWEVLGIGTGEEGEDLPEEGRDAVAVGRRYIAEEGGDGEQRGGGPAGRGEEGGERGGCGGGGGIERQDCGEEGEVTRGGDGGERGEDVTEGVERELREVDRRAGGIPGGLPEDGLGGGRRRRRWLLRGGRAGRGRRRRHRRRTAAGRFRCSSGNRVGFPSLAFPFPEFFFLPTERELLAFLFRGLLATSPLALAALARAGLGVVDSRQPARR